MNNFQIIDFPEYFKNSSDNYPVPYRVIIIHAMYYYFHKIYQKDGEDVVIFEFDQLYGILKDAIKSLNEAGDMDPLVLPDLFEIYPFNYQYHEEIEDWETGLLFVDKSTSENYIKGVFPLVFYPDIRQTEKDRKSVLIISLEEILAKWEVFISDYFLPNAKLNNNFSIFKDDICSKLKHFPDRIAN